MDSIAYQKLRESIQDARDIRLECLKPFSDIDLIHERVARIYSNLCLIFDGAYASLLALRGTEGKRNGDGSPDPDTLQAQFDSLMGPERDSLLERARQTLPPGSQNDADAVMIAALEMLANGRERTS